MKGTLENVGSGVDVNDIIAVLVGRLPDLCVCVDFYVFYESVAAVETVV